MAADTKQIILDTAEELIAEKGIDAVSLRLITSEAKVNLAAVHYHFGSKEALVEKVFARRVAPLNDHRLRMLTAAEERAGSGPLPAEDVLRALIEPALRLDQEDGKGRSFMHMCGRIYAEQADYVQRIFDDLFHEIVVRFSAAFARALPDVPDVERTWRVHFSVGAMIHTMLDSEKIKSYSNGLCDPSDVEATIERMIRFCAAGLRAEIEDGAAQQADATEDVAQ